MVTPTFDFNLVQNKLVELGEVSLQEELSVHLLVGGKSNLTYELRSGGRAWILRRPPLGHVLETAHDMSREVTVQKALAHTDFPVPRILWQQHASGDAAGFYLMQKVEGRVLRTDADLEQIPAASRRALAIAYIDTLADLHSLDPGSVGLGNFGRPEGYLGRQMVRWGRQLDASRSRPLPGLDALGVALNRRIPGTTDGAIIHGDFRLDNMILVHEDTGIAAVLDWEMATLGDPLTDLGLVYLFWQGWAGIENPIAGTPSSHTGYPDFSELAAHYEMRTRADMTNLWWYKAFACFKLAVILEGIHLRHLRGDTEGDGFASIGDMVAPLADRGRLLVP